METNIYNQKAEETGKINLPESVQSALEQRPRPPNSRGDDSQQKDAGRAHQRKRRSQRRGQEALETEGFGQGQARFHQVSDLGGRRRRPWPKERQRLFRKNQCQSQEKSFFTVLSQKLRDNEILFLDKIDFSQPKTKKAVEIVNSLSKIGGFEKIKAKKKTKPFWRWTKRTECFQKFPQHSGHGNLPSPQPQHFGYFEI